MHIGVIQIKTSSCHHRGTLPKEKRIISNTTDKLSHHTVVTQTVEHTLMVYDIGEFNHELIDFRKIYIIETKLKYKISE